MNALHQELYIAYIFTRMVLSQTRMETLEQEFNANCLVLSLGQHATHFDSETEALIIV
jgi:hypothetical protein